MDASGEKYRLCSWLPLETFFFLFFVDEGGYSLGGLSDATSNQNVVGCQSKKKASRGHCLSSASLSAGKSTEDGRRVLVYDTPRALVPYTQEQRLKVDSRSMTERRDDPCAEDTCIAGSSSPPHVLAPSHVGTGMLCW